MSDPIVHYHSVRLRVNGSGTLKSRFVSLNEINQQQLMNLNLDTQSNRLPTLLANFNEQRASLELWTDEFGDYFEINKITIYAKPIFLSFPQ